MTGFLMTELMKNEFRKKKKYMNVMNLTGQLIL